MQGECFNNCRYSISIKVIKDVYAGPNKLLWCPIEIRFYSLFDFIIGATSLQIMFCGCGVWPSSAWNKLNQLRDFSKISLVVNQFWRSFIQLRSGNTFSDCFDHCFNKLIRTFWAILKKCTIYLRYFSADLTENLTCSCLVFIRKRKCE